MAAKRRKKKSKVKIKARKRSPAKKRRAPSGRKRRAAPRKHDGIVGGIIGAVTAATGILGYQKLKSNG